ncbi:MULTISPECIES: hypothetical protein [unclassified Campylobacter]|uniref:hypothetical protein n=1 Tax=unclassified Campylobacter TaxID=2593542 RepID=UPI0022E9AC32|nr:MULTISPECIES: hypothetical protein [unclassified Campylobacter]MDA3062335.1 hypothetical protein [Campylobacter sp. JMF_14 EL1]MDA3073547.1 hypothetical protein [Campylobacter sp. JMF_10 EL2]
MAWLNFANLKYKNFLLSTENFKRIKGAKIKFDKNIKFGGQGYPPYGAGTGKNKIGGYWTKNGKIVTFWD